MVMILLVSFIFSFLLIFVSSSFRFNLKHLKITQTKDKTRKGRKTRQQANLNAILS
ncbi:hypothetical protein Fmac_011271 [Flemingia macrophylla]|uniref:ATP synthase F0 subunit 8 n=1 Tax=Flemingia macrophylla TaxID=520843 RepID=A0ABD1MLZ3_9FABA